MSWFGGPGVSSDDGGGSKLRSPSSYEFDSSPDHSSGMSGFSSGSSLGGGGSADDMQQQVMMEQQKLQFMQQVHHLNETCWDTCVGSVSSSLSSREENCLKNCAGRFVDVTLLISNRFAQLAQKMQQH